MSTTNHTLTPSEDDSNATDSDRVNRPFEYTIDPGGMRGSGEQTPAEERLEARDIFVQPGKNDSVYRVTDQTKARELRDEDDIDASEALDRATYHVRVDHARGLVLRVLDENHGQFRLSDPTNEHPDKLTGTVPELAVGRELGYEVLSRDIERDDIQLLKLLKETGAAEGLKEALSQGDVESLEAIASPGMER